MNREQALGIICILQLIVIIVCCWVLANLAQEHVIHKYETSSEFDTVVEQQMIIEEQNNTINDLTEEVEKWQDRFDNAWNSYRECVEGEERV